MSENKYGLEQERENLLVFIWKKRKIILITTGAAVIVSTVIALLLTPMFLSTAIVFPAATSTVSFSDQRNAKASSMDFGEEEQAEQMVQILQSSRIRDKIVEQFGLLKHYDIDENDPNKHHKLVKEYENHFEFIRTRYSSIQIDVLDRDPKLAADMANKIVDLIDTVKNNMVQERTWPAFEINKRKKDQLEAERDNLIGRMDSLSNLGVISLDGRTNLFQAYVDATNAKEKAEIKAAIDVNQKFGSIFDGLENIRDEKVMQLEEFRVSYEQAESDAYTLFNHRFVVERAVVADKKEKPKRLIIVLLAMIGTFVFMVFALLITERIKELKKLA